MAEINLGVMKPAYLAKGEALKASGMAHFNASIKSSAMSRHPSAGSRSAEFHSQAQAHLGKAKQARVAYRGLPAQSTGQSFQTGSSNDAQKQKAKFN